MLFARSVRRNILYGLEVEDGVPQEEVPSNEDVEEAARLANAHDFIMAMPQGYDTVRLSIRSHATLLPPTLMCMLHVVVSPFQVTRAWVLSWITQHGLAVWPVARKQEWNEHAGLRGEGGVAVRGTEAAHSHSKGAREEAHCAVVR